MCKNFKKIKINKKSIKKPKKTTKKNSDNKNGT